MKKIILFLLLSITIFSQQPFFRSGHIRRDANYWLNDTTKSVLFGAADTINPKKAMWFKSWNGQILLDGSLGYSPMYSFTGATDNGMGYSATYGVIFMDGGVPSITLSNSAVSLNHVTEIKWNTTYLSSGTTFDLKLGRDAAGILAQRVGEDATQTYRLYGDDSTGTGADKWLELISTADSAIIGTSGNYVGVNGGDIYLQTAQNGLVVSEDYTTGAATALLGTNSPATVASAPYAWIKLKLSDGTIVYVPAWK